MTAISKSARAAGRRGRVGSIGYCAGVGSGRPAEILSGSGPCGVKVGLYSVTVGFGDVRGLRSWALTSPSLWTPPLQPDSLGMG